MATMNLEAPKKFIGELSTGQKWIVRIKMLLVSVAGTNRFRGRNIICKCMEKYVFSKSYFNCTCIFAYMHKTEMFGEDRLRYPEEIQ